MTFKEQQDIIDKLRDDKHYFGELGKQYLSNSDINVLYKNPDLYGQGFSESVDFLLGKYLHYKILQPDYFDLEQPMLIVDVNSRNNKEYQDLVKEHTIEGQDKPLFLLRKEVITMDPIIENVKNNKFFKEHLVDDIYENNIEEPSIGIIKGNWFKGRADRINVPKRVVCDLKTTQSLSSFVKNFKQYGYHTQAYIYQELFGMPVKFFVIDKSSGRLGVFDVSDETLSEAEIVIEKALENLNYYYKGEDAEKNRNQHYSYGLL